MLKREVQYPEEKARQGDLQVGYQHLLRGSRRAEAARDAGRSWGEETVCGYQALIDAYVERYGIAR